MKIFVRVCLLIAFGVPLLLLFMVLIATQGDDAADQMVGVLDRWLHS
jgi:hypothetical protein